MSTVVERTDRQYDLFDPAFYDEPLAAYRWMRDEAPVYRDATNEVWAFSRYSDVVWAEKNPQIFSSAIGSRPWAGSLRNTDGKEHLLADPRLGVFSQEPIRRQMMINEDDPKHQQMRQVLYPGFTPKAVGGHEARVRSVVTSLLDAVAGRGECDFAQEVAAQLPVIVIGDLMGYPAEDRPVLLRCADLVNAAGTGPGFRHWSEESLEALHDFHQATMRLLAERRAEPRDDLISLLATTPFDGQLLNDTEIFNEMLLLNDGGADTTRYVITGGVKALLEHRDQLRLAQDDARRWPAVVEECLRWVTPIVNMCRSVNHDIDVHGTTIPAGDWVALLYGAANTDERVFKDPERFDLTRTGESRHVAFGFGTHFCLGAHLARLEVRVMFEELFRRFPDIEVTGPPVTSPTAFVRGINHMPVSLGADRGAA